jgi:ABC-type Mn2+/Zn2+ transport system ATPase subunit
MDEPTASMDADGERLVERATRELAAGGTTVLWVNHDWAQVRRIADTVTIVNRGLAVRGSADDLMVREPALPGEAA